MLKFRKNSPTTIQKLPCLTTKSLPNTLQTQKSRKRISLKSLYPYKRKKVISNTNFDLIKIPSIDNFDNNFENLPENFWHDVDSGSVRSLNLETVHQLLPVMKSTTSSLPSWNANQFNRSNHNQIHKLSDGSRNVKVIIENKNIKITGEEKSKNGIIKFEKIINLPKFVIKNQLQNRVKSLLHIDEKTFENHIEIIYPNIDVESIRISPNDTTSEYDNSSTEKLISQKPQKPSESSNDSSFFTQVSMRDIAVDTWSSTTFEDSLTLISPKSVVCNSLDAKSRPFFSKA